jgi:hypothetical protein
MVCDVLKILVRSAPCRRNSLFATTHIRLNLVVILEVSEPSIAEGKNPPTSADPVVVEPFLCTAVTPTPSSEYRLQESLSESTSEKFNKQNNQNKAICN